MKLKTVIRKTRNMCFVLAYHGMCVLPLQNKIVFTSEGRESLSGNLEYIEAELAKRHLPLKIKVMVRDKKKTPPTLGMFLKLAYECATSKFIIIDDFYPRLYKLRIRKRANFMQVWHAVGAFKQFGYARVGLPGGPDPNSINHRNYTQVVVSSQAVVDIYARSFGVDPKIVLPLGDARTDLFFDQTRLAAMKREFYNNHPEWRGKRIVLFAPTFRGNGQMSAYYPKEWLDIEQLYDRIKDTDTVVALKFHPYVKDRVEIPAQMQDKIIDFSDDREINPLLIVADQLITDYSSSIFEYSLLERKMIFYAPDLDEYTDNRSFYFDYQDFVPGNVYYNFNDVLDAMMDRAFDQNKVEAFRDKFFDRRDGQSSKRVVDYITNRIGVDK